MTLSMKKFSAFVLVVAASSLLGYALCGTLTINSASEFIQFSEDTSSGTTFKGTTVYLDNDLDFSGSLSERFAPVDNFLGSFDGKGHVVRNLVVNSSNFTDLGLFGYAGGDVQNVVIDDSCSFTSSFSEEDVGTVTLSGLVCSFVSKEGPSAVKNSVNMARLTYTGEPSDITSVLISGIVSDLDSGRDYGVAIKNCANYGDITHAGLCDIVFVGGISLYCWSDGVKATIYNVVNYGTITITKKSSCKEVEDI